MPESKISPEWSILKMLEWGTDYLQNKHINSPRLSMEWLLSSILECKRLDLYLAFDRPLSRQELDILKPMLLRRANHEPLQYITGSTDFFGLPIEVNPNVLIPRPETEQLVEKLLEEHPADDGPRTVLDLGTGSGCIPIAIKSKRPDWNVFACDISEPALELARENAFATNQDIHFFCHDFFNSELPSGIAKPDIIISNPPYIPLSEKDNIDREVKDWEPQQALFHENIETVYASVISLAAANLTKNGKLFLEIHEKMGSEILSLLPGTQWKKTLTDDYSMRNRIIIARLI